MAVRKISSSGQCRRWALALLLFDSTLSLVRVVADSSPLTQNAYGARGGGLLSHGGDSALFVDPGSLTMMIVSPDGTLGGVRAVPRSMPRGA